MRFSTFATTLASVASIVATTPLALQARQEAARFGLVFVTPRDFVGGDDITIVYNASTAIHHPEFVDFYIQGTFTDTSNRTPFFLIQRNNFAADQQILTLNEHVPDALNNLGAENWVLTAFVTFEQDGLTEVGGISA